MLCIGKYCVAFDPLDGSSNIDCNVSTGTIFAVWEKKSEGPATVDDILRPGNEIVCAGYCAYGSATELVLAYGVHGVQRFTLDPSLGEFILTGTDLRLPEISKVCVFSHNNHLFLCYKRNTMLHYRPFILSMRVITAHGMNPCKELWINSV